MQRDYLSIENTPLEENCISVTLEKPYLTEMKLEALKYVELLKKRFNKFDKVDIKIKKNNHDFGEYYDIAIYYDLDDKESEAQAYCIESNLPNKWSDEEEIPIEAINEFFD